MSKWTNENAIEQLQEFIQEIQSLQHSCTNSAEHTRWLFRVTQFLLDVFGPASLYSINFGKIPWRYYGSMAVHTNEVFRPGSTEARYNAPVYQRGLDLALGMLSAAGDELIRNGVEAVYKGKKFGPKASIAIRILNLAEIKLRKVIRGKPTKEREVQDAFESLLVGADIKYSREADSIEYSSKTYVPDFTVVEADLAIEIKLSTKESHEKEFIAQINDDILAYGTKYGNLLFVVYDCGFIRDIDRFISSFEANQAVMVRVVKH